MLKTISSKKNHRPSGFTLIEILIVIIIISILVGIALPKYTNLIEYARGLEAFINLGALRQSAYRYYLPTRSYLGMTIDNLDIGNPSTQPGANFSYTLQPTLYVYSLIATRNTRDGGDGFSTISLSQDGDRAGGGVYANIR